MFYAALKVAICFVEQKPFIVFMFSSPFLILVVRGGGPSLARGGGPSLARCV